MAPLFTLYNAVTHNAAARSGARTSPLKFAWMTWPRTHSTEGVCGPSFNGGVNDHQIGFH
jgi:hypothetical protein